MSINPISAQSFKGLWHIKQISQYEYGTNTIEKTFTYHPFADEKVDTLDIQEKTKEIVGKYTCTEYDDNDHQFPHTIENKFELGEPLKDTAERYSTLVKSIVSQYGNIIYIERQVIFMFYSTDCNYIVKVNDGKTHYECYTTEQVKEHIVPDQIDFGKSKSRFDYSDVQKIR